MTAVHEPVDARDDVPRRVSTNPATVDRVFHGSARTVGTTVLLITGSIGLFLALQSIPTLRRYGLNFFTETRWSPDLGVVGIASVLLGTLTIALVALADRVPARHADRAVHHRVRAAASCARCSSRWST